MVTLCYFDWHYWQKWVGFMGIRCIMEYEWNMNGIWMEYEWNMNGIYWWLPGGVIKRGLQETPPLINDVPAIISIMWGEGFQLATFDTRCYSQKIPHLPMGNKKNMVSKACCGRSLSFQSGLMSYHKVSPLSNSRDHCFICPTLNWVGSMRHPPRGNRIPQSIHWFIALNIAANIITCR